MNLKDLIAKQSGAKTNENPANPARTVQPAENPEQQESGSDEQDGAGSVPPSDAPAPAPAKPAGLGLNLIGKSGVRGASSPATKPTPAPRVASDDVDSQSGDDGRVEFTLDDIASLDESATPVVDRRVIEFDDEIEATAPDRELPADLVPQQLAFVESLDTIYQVLNDPEMFGQSVRMIMMELQENPEYVKLVSDQDVHTMIRAMRNTMGLARIKKTEKKRAAPGTRKARGPKVDDDVMGLLNSMGFEGD